MEYTYKINSIKTATVNGVDNVITNVYWTLTGKDENEKEGVFNGATPFDTVDTTKAFIAFESLTEQDVIKWIEKIVTGTYKDHIYEQINRQIGANTPIDAKLPWESNNQ